MKKTKCDTITGHMIWSQKSHDHMIQRRYRRFWNKMKSYSMAIVC